MGILLVTGSSGLVGSACVEHFSGLGWDVYGVDNNLRADFFGRDGDTSWNLARLKSSCARFEHQPLDIRDRQGVLDCLARIKPNLILHCEAQPSHELAALRPFDDFDVNVAGTMNLLEATRRSAAGAVFCFLSTSKVYGEAVNELPLREEATRFDYALPEQFAGIDEMLRVDQSRHSIYGADKTAADILVQEYGRYYGLQTACFRGGCLTGPAHSAAEMHGFLAYLMKCLREDRVYRIFGYQGKQVRDNLHAIDVCRAFEEFFLAPRAGEVYNLGGGRANSVSLLEAISLAEQISSRKLSVEYIAEERIGDHICYISNVAKFRSHFPRWNVTRSIEAIIEELWTNAKIVSSNARSTPG